MKTPRKKESIEHAVKEIAREAQALARHIGEWAEPAFQEVQSAKEIADFLHRHGFDVEFSFNNIPTAFRARRGRGGPTVGFLGEYDALPDCGPGQGNYGHGCSHNLLGVGSAVGAVAAASVLEQHALKGTLVYYGCPAEELVGGKAYMARDGAFRDLDACLAWHPSNRTRAAYYGGSALDSVLYEFYGKTAHAAYPVGGKSALDAAILFDIAVNYLRESIPDNVRIHSVILNGGDAPNVVPAYAKSWYYIRGKDRAQVNEIRKRVDDCARGAAIATQTRHKETLVSAIPNQLPNERLFHVVHENLTLFGPPRPGMTDLRRAKDLGLTQGFNRTVDDRGKRTAGLASSDDYTVSWLAPLGKFLMTTAARGTPFHHRLQTAQAVLPFAMRGMLQAGKVMAGAALDLVSTPRHLACIRKEFLQTTEGAPFDPLIPKRQKIPVGLG